MMQSTMDTKDPGSWFHPPGPKHPEYALHPRRLLSFALWPDKRPGAEDLCNAGFYYTGI